MIDATKVLRGEGVRLVDEAGGYAGQLGISAEQVIGLCAAPNNSLVTLHRVDSWEGKLRDREKVPVGLHVVVQSDYIRDGSTNEFVVFKEPASDRASVYVKLIDFKTGGYGGALIRRIATQAAKAGMVRLRLLAAGGRLWEPREDESFWVGYSAWPKYGFDMLLRGSPRKDKSWEISGNFPYAPPKLGSCLTVQDVLKTNGGREFWRVCGNGSYMEFDLSASSQAWKTLNMETKGEPEMMSKDDDEPVNWEEQPAGYACSPMVHAAPAAAEQPHGWLPSLDDSETDKSVLSVMKSRRRAGAELIEG